MDNYISLTFPFKESEIGYIFAFNTDSVSAIKSDVLHILTTRKGTRFFNRNFGTSLHEFLFDPNDSVTITDVKNEVNNILESIRPDIVVKSMDLIDEDLSVKINIILYDNTNSSEYNMKLLIDK